MIGFGRTMRNIGGRASSSAMEKAVQTSLGDNTPRRLVKHTGRGSSAGLNAQKTARLEANGTGYANSALHKNKQLNKSYPEHTADTMGPIVHFKRKTLHRTNDLTPYKYPR